MSYCATVGGRAANSNLIKLKKIIFTPIFDKSYVHCDFSKWLIDYFKNANEFKLFVCCCCYFVFTSVDLLLLKIKIFDWLT